MVVQATLPAYEAQTQTIAQSLLAAVRGEGKSLLAQWRDQLRWDDRLLAWAMESPHLRAQLFRLIDVLPSLKSKTEVARHLQEYLSDAAVELPSLLKNLLNFADPDSLPGQLAASTLTTAVEALAHRYIAGETLKQVSKTLEQLHRQGMTFTVDLLGEAVITEAEAQSYLERYLQVMEHLATAVKTWPQPQPQPQVSVKLTAFYSQFDPFDPVGAKARVGERIRPLLRRAAELGVGIHFDMEQYRYKSLTLSILQELLLEPEFRNRTDVGLTLQAYLRDSYTDLQNLISWAQERGSPVTVRLVKGAYWDQETILAAQKHWPQPVYNDKAATDANFERLTQLLLEHHTHLYAAIGSHNVRSQAKAIAIAEALGVPKPAFEMQVLYGMADKLAKALVQTGHRVRVYCPYGALLPGMAYLIRRLLENTANSSFLRQSVQGYEAEQLLAPPAFDAASVFQAAPLSFPAAADSDFSQPSQRDPFFQALQKVQTQLGQKVQPWIAGQYQATPQAIPSLNPANPEQVVGEIGLTSPEQVEEALAAAQACFPLWKRTPVSVRAGILRRVAEQIADQRAELAAWMVLEVGKPIPQADGEISEAIDFCRYYAQQMETLERGQERHVPGETNRYHYQPRGLAVVIAPWNFPLSIACGMTVAALVTGNCVLLKPAEQSSVIAAKLAGFILTALSEAGIPAGVFQFLPGVGEAIGPLLVKDPRVHLIAFTGSQAVGCQILAQAAQLAPGQQHIKRVIAEMGGKNAIIVDESADLDQAVKGVINSAFGYSGQKCSACSRVILLEPIHDLFLGRLIEATQSLNIGDPAHPSTQVGPVIDGEAQARLQQAIQSAQSYAHLELSLPVPERGYFVGPTLFSQVDPQSDLAQRELFGPVLAILRVPNFSTALEMANATPYALTGGLYSRTPSHIEQARQDFAVGNLYINRDITGALVERQPFGGFKLSGVGSKAGGPDYLLQFLEPRTLTENIQRQGFAPIEGS
ncbi:L-glutamate gamma-semialdehyde dehydrogenase [Thermostichus vulcanus]|uniref:L-glutamate gamma-semialdehyde dehydrogenase n=1 Tax=Thermostichus vulcanus str. 'Rupite' TaxID=2813851 RepID=A0ABT0C9I2_THEVL|nr:L-glutamate gamma-semialdehyde dehydrogenase [Thermostichus vulcanus]MCJ2542448.1 L-glutamate gamma-semialdehyde dehydrogenase [Thermostichus vulcanus str. 'Rupite']